MHTFASVLFIGILLGTPEIANPPELLKARMGKLAVELGSPNFRVREEASRQFEEFGEEALPALRVASHSKDLEVRTRAQRLVRAIEIRLYREVACMTGHTDDVFSVAVSADGSLIASGGHDATVRLWDVKTGKELSCSTSHKETVLCVDISADGKLVSSSGMGDEIKLWEIIKGNTRRFHGHEGGTNFVKISTDSTKLLSAGHDKTLRLWDIKSGKEIMCFRGHTSSIRSAAFSQDGTTIVSGASDASVRIWDVKSGKELNRYTTSPVFAGIFISADGKRAAAAHLSSTIWLFDVLAARKLPDTKAPGRSVFGGVDFADDGRRAITGGYDGGVRIWDTKSGKLLWLYESHKGAVRSVAFFKDGRHAISVCRDKTVRVWRVPPINE